MWYYEQEAKFPWRITIQPVGLKVDRYAYSSEAKSVEEVMRGEGFDWNVRDDVILKNVEQLELIQMICDDHNKNLHN